MQLVLAFVAALLCGFKMAAGEYCVTVYWAMVTVYWVLNFVSTYIGGKRND